MILKLIISCLSILLGVYVFIMRFKKSRRIDTESVAVVKEVRPLGRDDGRKVYAILYEVQSHDPFDLLDTPCKKIYKPGKKRSIFYEKAEPQKNFYFKTLFQFDRRLYIPILMILSGIMLMISTFII